MIERISLRVGDFVGTTAGRTVRAVEDVVPGLRPPRRRLRVLTPARDVMGAAAVAAGLASSDPSRRREIAGRARELADNLLSDRTRSNGRQATRRVTDLAERTRAELYELARDASIEGRSRMSKNELATALAGTTKGS